MLTEELSQLLVCLGCLLEQTLVDDVADVGGGKMDAELLLEAALEFAEHRGLVGLFELLLAGHYEPRLALKTLAQFRDEGLQLEHALLVLVDVLRDFVDDDEERLARGTAVEHVRDRPRGFSDGGGLRNCTGTGHDPGHRIRVAVWVEGMHHLGKGFLGQGLVLNVGPRLAEHFFGLRLELGPAAVTLEIKLKLGHEGLRAAVAQALLDLAHDRRMDVLVVASETPDIKDHCNRVDLLAKGAPSVPELLTLRRRIPSKQSLGNRSSIRERHAVECQPQQLRKARLARAIEARDPRGGKIRAPASAKLLHYCSQELNVLFVDPVGDPLVVRVILRESARNYVFANLGCEFLGALFVEIDHGRDVAGHI